MIRKKYMIFIFLGMVITLLTACTPKEERDYKVMHCSRKAESAAGDQVDIKLSYDIYYKDDYVKKVIATDQVTSSDPDIIDQYTDSYKKVYAAYDGLKYFENDIKVSTNTMTSVTTIDYAHIDTDKLLEIEGKEDNVVNEEGKVPLKDFLAFYEKYGVECD